MKNKKNIIIIVGVLAIFSISLFAIYSLTGNKDAIKFKKDYESLNNTVRKSDGANYNNVDIPKNNPIKYVTAKEATDIIKNKKGVIYFGANWCPWCRNGVEVLFEAAKKKNLDTIYYLDMDTAKNTWEIQNGKVVKTEEEKEGYYELLDSLSSILSDYVLKDENGVSYDTGEKRIYMPLVIAVDKGKITDTHRGTVSLDEGQTKYDKMTSTQHDELLKEYNTLIDSLNRATCDNEVCS